MNGMELSKAYFEEYGKKLIGEFSSYSQYIAAGLVGEGSECYKYDDQISRDHDFGPGFCIWLPEKIYLAIGKAMQREYDSLPKEFAGVRRNETPEGKGRVGVFSIEDFYFRYTGCRPLPVDNKEWFLIPERFLSIATNGEIFVDYYGEFTKARQKLKDFYPTDVLRKKLATRVAVMAQAGQYNHPRSMARGDLGAAFLSCSKFIEASISAIYLLNGEYTPFYKWAFRGMENLPQLKVATNSLMDLVKLSGSNVEDSRKQQLIESICIDVARELNRRGFSSSRDDFLQSHLGEIMSGISDSRLRRVHVMADND